MVLGDNNSNFRIYKMSKKRVLITGAGGFVGSYLINELKKDDEYEIFGSVYQSTSDISALLSKDHILVGDLTDPIVASAHLQSSKPDLIFHLAALSIVHDSHVKALPIMQKNTAISYNLLEAARTVSPQARFVAICSANIYGDVDPSQVPIKESTPMRPLNPYAISKATQELLAQQYYLAHGLDVVIIRPFNHTGIGQTADFLIPNLAKILVQIENSVVEPVIKLGNLDSVRDFTDVRDMVRGYVMLAKKGESGQIYNLGSGRGYSVREIGGIFRSHAKKGFELIHDPALDRPADVPVLIADTSKAEKLIKFEPQFSLESTILDILEYERKQHG